MRSTNASISTEHVSFNDGNRDWAIPYKVYDSGVEGPSLLVMGGIHGGEQVGCEVALRLMDVMEKRPLERGRLVIAPFACLPGVRKGDNIWGSVISKNQTWPGKADGNEKERWYHALTEQLLPRATHVIDLHCFNHYKSTTSFAPVDDTESRELALAGDLPFTLLQQPQHYTQPRRTAGEGDSLPKITATSYCYQIGKPAVLIEFPGGLVNFPGGMINRRKPEPGLRAVRRMMVKLEMLEPESEEESEPSTTTKLRVLEQKPEEGFESSLADVQAERDGLFLRVIGDPVSGDWVEKGESLGKLYWAGELERLDVPSPVTGRLFRIGARCTGGPIHAFAQAGTMLAQVMQLDQPDEEVVVCREEISMSGPKIK